jgi:hypothetical protein
MGLFNRVSAEKAMVPATITTTTFTLKQGTTAVSGAVTYGQAILGTAADFKEIILSRTLISLNTGAKMNGRALRLH